MCCFKSGLILKDRVFIPDYDSHVDMLKELKIQDTSFTPDFVKVEFLPPVNPKLDPSDYSNWIYKIDQDQLPEWYIDKIDRKRFIEEFKIYAKDNIVINEEITEKSKDYKVYINCTGSLKYRTNVELVYNCNFKQIYQCFINWLKGTSVMSLDKTIIDNMASNDIESAYDCKILHSTNNSYNTALCVSLHTSTNDKIRDFSSSFSNHMRNGKINYISGSMVRYHHMAGKELKPKLNYLNSVIINNNQETNSHDVTFSIDHKKDTVSLNVKYDELDNYCSCL